MTHCKTATSSYGHFYFNHIARLWNTSTLPPIDISSSLPSIRSTITNLLWSHFEPHFDSSSHAHFTLNALAPSACTLLLYILQTLNTSQPAFSKLLSCPQYKLYGIILLSAPVLYLCLCCIVSINESNLGSSKCI